MVTMMKTVMTMMHWRACVLCLVLVCASVVTAALPDPAAAVPALDPSQPKGGQGGSVLVIGGSPLYVGAPFFAAMASLRTGADLAFVATHADAAGPLKVMSPDVMVLPLWSSEGGVAPRAWATFEALVRRARAVVLGSGLGRAPGVEALVARRIIPLLRRAGVPVVVDADALWMVARAPSLVRGWAEATLTPNANEWTRVRDRVWAEEWAQGLVEHVPNKEALEPHHVSAILGNVTVLLKGASDVIACGSSVRDVVRVSGSPRRCGGMGDLLAGAMAVMQGWASTACADGSAPTAACGVARAAACVAASTLVRRAAAAAFQSQGRGMLATDVLAVLPHTFHALFEGGADAAPVGVNATGSMIPGYM